MTDTERRLRELEDEVRYLRRRLDDAIARPPAVVPVYPQSPSVPAVPWQPLGPVYCDTTWSSMDTGSRQ